MRLRSLEIQGFKSFPDKTTLSFGDGITGVVGPNGSGKSNIVDAVRWVLGEQSTKNLRGGKMEDVIFGGTQTRKAVGYASVQLVIDNEGGAMPDLGETVAISRRLYRSGESEYRLNGSMVRLKDITELLMDTGLGRDGYSIIGQGKIAEIVSAKSRERREIFEEATGIVKYRYRKEEAEKKLGQAQENLLRLYDIVKELEDRVEPLRVQSEKAKTFLSLSEEKKGLEISLWMLSLDLLREQIAAEQDKLDLCRHDYSLLEEEGEGIEAEMATVSRRMQEMNISAEEKRATLRETQEHIAQADSQIAVYENDIHHNTQTVERLTAELESAGKDAGELRAQAAVKQDERSEAAKALLVLEGKIAAANERLDAQKEQMTRVEEEIEALSVRRKSIDDAIQSALISKHSSETLLTESTRRLETLKQNSGTHDSVIAELEQNIQECKTCIAEQEEKTASLGNAQKGYALKRQGREEKLREIQQRLVKLERDAEQKLQRAKLLEDLEANMEGFAGSVKYILGQVKKGILGGVHGAVSSLISVESKYTLAIETALGAAMQNVVVKDEETAKRAIRELQNARAGRATFLPLSAVKGRPLDMGRVRQEDGFIGVASGLVSFDPKYTGVMTQLLGRIVIAEDLDSGTRIAKSNGYSFRIVTLDGQVIGAGGAFTGGSSHKSAGVLGRRAEIDKLRADADTLKSQCAQVEPDKRRLETELAAIDASIAGAAAEARTAQEETVRLGFELGTLERNLVQAQENKILAVKELDGLLARLEELENSGAGAQELLDRMEAELAELTAQSDAASARRETLRVGSETAVQALGELKMLELTAQKDDELLEQEILRLLAQADTAGENRQRLEAEQQLTKAKNESIQAEIARLREKQAELSELTHTLEVGIADVLSRRTALEGDTTKLRQRERELAEKRESVSRELARLEERGRSVQGEYDGIIAKLWDEYELTRSQAAQAAVPLEDKDKASRRLTELRGKIKGLGSVNVAAIEEYLQVSERYEFLTAQIADVEQAKSQLQQLLGELTEEMRGIFSENFAKIATHFSTIFVQLFGGGRGQLTLTDDDVLESGIEIYVQPPGKVIKNLSLLSGGEQALVAIAIYFAILKVRPAPFCILDEIEAALDDVNVQRFANYLRQMSKNTQFIAITHRRGTMEEADVLYGVTMQDEGVSKLLELSVNEVQEKLGIK